MAYRLLIALALVGLAVSSASAQGVSSLNGRLRADAISAEPVVPKAGIVDPKGDDQRLLDGPDGQPVGDAFSGRFVRILERQGDWYKVQAGSVTGFLPVGKVTTARGASAFKAAPATGTITTREGVTLNVRDGAWGDKIGRLESGASVEILGREGDWYRIKHDGKVGYVFAAYVKAGSATAADPADGTPTKPKPPADKPKPPADKSKPPADKPKPPADDPGPPSTGGGPARGHVPIRSQLAPENGSNGRSWCGPTSLGMVFDFYGKHPATREIAKVALTSMSGGTDAYMIAKAASHFGLKGTVKEGMSVESLAAIVNSGTPVIANVNTQGMWSSGHYYVVTQIKDGKVYINDPWRGAERVYSVQSFKAQWSSRNNKGIVIKP